MMNPVCVSRKLKNKAAVASLGCLLLLSSSAIADDLPEAKTIAMDAAKAMGGKKIDAIKSYHSVAEMTVTGMTLNTESFWSSDGGRHVKQVVPGMGEMVSATDGKIGWASNPMGGYRLMTEQELATLDDQVFHMSMLHMEESIDEDFKEFETVERASFEGHDCYKIRFVEKEAVEGAGPNYLFFDIESKLPVGAETSANTPGGPQTAIMVFKDWKAMDGVMFFQKLSFTGGGQEATIDFSKIELNNVDPKVFEAPAEVKTMAEKSKDAPAADGKGLDNLTPAQKQQVQQMEMAINMINDPAQLEQMITSMEASLDQVPADQKPVMDHVLEKAKAKLASLKGE